MLLLDTDILIDFLRRFPPAVEWFAGLTEIPMVPGFAAMELVQGCRNSDDLRAVQKLVEPFTVVWPKPEDCEVALGFYSKFYLSHNLGLLDSLIAGLISSLDAELCTFNEKHFRAVPDLKLLAPYARS